MLGLFIFINLIGGIGLLAFFLGVLSKGLNSDGYREGKSLQ